MKSIILSITFLLGLALAVSPPLDISPPVVVANDSETPNGSPEPLFVEVEVPSEIEPYELVIVAVDTNAQHSRVRVRRSMFDTVDVHPLRPVGTYGWVGPPGEYLVEVDVFDATRGIDGRLKKVTVGDPPKPDPPTDPPLSGFGLAAQVPTWMATVPQAARSDIPAIQAAMRDVADKASQWDSIADMQAALGVMLGQAIKQPGWATFGESMSAAMNSLVASGKIDTTAKCADALREIAGAM